MELLEGFARTAQSTLFDLLPIAVVLIGFRVFVIRRPLVRQRQTLLGFGFALLGLSLFLLGLETALFPLGRIMAEQLTSHAIAAASAAGDAGASNDWRNYLWLYTFAAAIGFATTIAEPALIAVALKAHEVSGGVVSPLALRLAVAVGVAFGVALGTYRIVTGAPLYWFIIAGYLVVIILTIRAQRWIVPLAYDSGGVTTSTVTVPLVAALGLGLATYIPGRSPLIDGFGLIAFASLFPMIAVMGYAQLTAWRQHVDAPRWRKK